MKYLSFASFILIFGYISFIRTEFIYSCKEKKTIALTFDDGPHKYTKELVDYFINEYPDDRITFFQVGKFHYPFAINVREYQKAMRKAHHNGFQIASHTFEHKIPDDEYEFKKVLTKMDDFIEEITGDRPRYFRAPKGHCNKECQDALEKWDYRLIQWDTDTNDWDLVTSGSPSQRVEDSIKFLKRRFAKEEDSYLILMHDTQNYTVSDIVPWIMKRSGMKEKGYKSVTVAECLGDKKGMYRSGKTYFKKKESNIPKNNTINTVAVTTTVPINNNASATSSNYFAGNVEHKLSNDALSIKPMTIISCIYLTLMTILINIIN